MYAITGITGKVGGMVAQTLLDAGAAVRGVVRDVAKAQRWADKGCELVVAEMEDRAALARAFTGTEGVFILPPSCFDPRPGFPEAKAVIAAVQGALEEARPSKVVCLSTIGAQATETNLLTQRTLMEQALSTLGIPVTFLRPGFFMENFTGDIALAREQGVLPSFLQPLDKPIPMVATADVGRVAGELLLQTWNGKRVVELEGSQVTPNEVAAELSKALNRPVRAEVVPRDQWPATFTGRGMRDPVPRMRMLDGFNEGWIKYEGDPSTVVKGRVGLAEVLGKLAG